MSNQNLSLWLHEQVVQKKMNSPFGYIILICITLGFCALLLFFGFEIGVILLGAVVALPIALLCIVNVEFGFFFAILFGFFLFFLDRIFPLGIPMGVVYESILYITFGGLILKEIVYGKSDWSVLKHPLFVVLWIWTVYELLQVFNPNAVSLNAYLYALRGILTKLVSIIVIIYLFKDISIIRKFTKFWVLLALLAALYGLKQELFGYFQFEYDWIFSDTKRFNLMFNWGRWRKFSFMSDVSVFGMSMAFSGIFCLIMALGPYTNFKRISLASAGILMLLGMTFSGTRTAYAMVPVGFLLYFLLTLNKRRTLVFAAVSTFAIVVVLFGPFYSPNVLRLRSILEPNEDPSMQVRNINRAKIQPYIFDHPIGGGVFTSGNLGLEHSPGHPLAGFQTDSGYLETALEEGLIGLIFELTFYFLVLYYGTKYYFRVKSKEIKTLYASYMCAFFALSIANYAQPSISQKPLGILMYSTFVLMVVLKEFDKGEPEEVPNIC